MPRKKQRKQAVKKKTDPLQGLFMDTVEQKWTVDLSSLFADAPLPRTAALNGQGQAATKSRHQSVEEVEAEGHGVSLSINQASIEWGWKNDTMSRRIKEANLVPAGTRRGYPVYRLRDLLRMDRIGQDGTLDPEKMQPGARLLHFKSENEKLKLAEAMGEVFPREQVADEFARVLKAVVNELETLTDRVEREARPAREVIEIIERIVVEMRERLAEAIAQGVTTDLEPKELEECSTETSED